MKSVASNSQSDDPRWVALLGQCIPRISKMLLSLPVLPVSHHQQQNGKASNLSQPQ